MTDPGTEPHGRPRGETPPGMPRWVKVSLIIALVVVAALIVIMALAGGEHGPGLHTRAGDPSGIVASSALGWHGVGAS